MITWIKCLFIGHDWETRSYPNDDALDMRAFWEDWQVCLRCGKDTREIWEIQDDNLIRMERIEMKLKERNL